MPTMDASVIATMQARRSLRRYTADPVPPAVITRLLDAAVWAPSAHNRQPWRFCVLQTDTIKVTLARAMGARLEHDLTADGAPPDLIARDVERSYNRITSAPVVIVVALSMVDMDVYHDPRRDHNEYVMAVQSVAMAGQNLLVAAHELGLGACWMCAPLFCPDVVRTTLDLPADWQPQGMITVGYPAEERTKMRRPPLVQWK